MRIDIIWTSIDILQYMEMATLNINEKCFFLNSKYVYILFFVFAKFFSDPFQNLLFFLIDYC